MEQEIKNEPLIKSRGYVSSIGSGMRLPLRHPLGFLRQVWPVVLTAFVVTALVGNMMADDCWLFFNMGFADGLTTHDLLSLPLLKVMGWLGLNGLMMCVLTGVMAYQMKRYAELNYLPSVQPWKMAGLMLPTLRRSAVLFVVGYAVLAVLAVLSLFLLPHRAWALAVFTFISLILSFVLSIGGMRYLMSDNSRLSSLAWPIVHITRTGGAFATWIVCGMVFVLVTMVGFIPALCCTYVGGMSDMAVLIGDGTDLPGSFVYVRALAFGLGTITESIALLFFIVPLAFSWGAQTAIENERENGTQE